jgi:hypothetical protein
VQPNDALADQGDLEAARWITEALPPDAKLLVNSAVRSWSPDYVVPTDGGYWLPLLAGRATTLLPLVYPGERGVALSAIDEMERISRAASSSIDDPTTIALLRTAGVTHVYFGVRGGPINEAKVAESPAFRRIYRRGGVSIYELVPSSVLADRLGSAIQPRGEDR